MVQDVLNIAHRIHVGHGLVIESVKVTDKMMLAVGFFDKEGG